MTDSVRAQPSSVSSIFRHPIEAAKSLLPTKRVSAEPAEDQGVIAKTKKVAGAALHAVAGSRWEVYGCDVNLVHQATKLVASGARKVGLIESPIPKDAELLEAIGEFRAKVDEKLKGITSLPQPTAPLLSCATPLPVPQVDSPAILQLRRIEELKRNELVDHVINYSTITFFDQKIFGSEQTSSIDFYRLLVSSHDPLQAYYDHLYTQSKFFFLLAKILIPLFRWFISVFLSPADHIMGGVNNIQKLIHEYFRDPENSRKEMRELFKSGKDYFYKLIALNESFVAIKKDPLHPEHALTLDEYIEKHLREDLVSQGRSPDFLCEKFNEKAIEFLNPQSGLPIIGGIVDGILRLILRPIINRLDPVHTLLESSLGQEGSDATFTYNLTALLIKKLKELHQKVKDNQQEQIRPLKDGERVLPTPAYQGVLSDEEKGLFREFLHNLLEYIPLEGLTEHEIENQLSQEEVGAIRRLIHKATHFISDKAEKGVTDTLEDLFLELCGMLTGVACDQEQKLQTWVDLLDLSSGFFTAPVVTYTTRDCMAIKEEAQNTVKELLNTALEFHFRDNPSKLEQKDIERRAERLVQNIHGHTEAFIEQMGALHDEINQAYDVNGVENLYSIKDYLLISLKSYLSNCRINLEDTLEFEGLSIETRGNIKRVIRNVIAQLDLILNEHTRLEEAIRVIEKRIPIFNAIQALPSKEVSSLNAALKEIRDIDEGINEESLRAAETRVNHLIDLERSLQQCNERNENLQTALEKSHTIFIYNAAIASRPKELQIPRLLQILQRTKDEQDIAALNDAFAPYGEPQIQEKVSILVQALQSANPQAIEAARSALRNTLVASPRIDSIDLNAIDHLQRELGALTLDSITMALDENQHQLALLSKLKEEASTRLHQQFSSLLASESALLKNEWDRVDTINSRLASQLKEIGSITQSLHTQDVLFSLHPGSAKYASVQKSYAKPNFEKITDQLLNVVLNPRHREQLLFRGPLSRLVL